MFVGSSDIGYRLTKQFSIDGMAVAVKSPAFN